MTDAPASSNKNPLEGINSSRLFTGSCVSLISTAVVFGVVTSMMGDFKSVFALTNTEAGNIGGATIWGFTISIFIFGPLCDAIGMRILMRFSLLCHIVGPLLMIFAERFGNGYWALFIGALVTSLANGTVEAVCNPLVATIYPDRKTQKLNQFHVWFPGGIVIGGLLAFAIDQLDPTFWEGLPMAAWQVKLGFVFVPTVIYGILFTGQKSPATERVQSSLTFGDMVKATLCRPLFIVLFLCMGITASIELGPGRWMGEVMGKVMGEFAGENAGILVLVYGSTLMAVLRFFAGPVVHKLSPTGLLVSSAILSGVGLAVLTYASGALAIFGAATLFYVGICYFWPTMLGVTSERVPKGGALALGLMGGWGMAVVGLVTVPIMGWITDMYGHEKIPLAQASTCIQQATEEMPRFKETGDAEAVRNIDQAIERINEVNDRILSDGALPEIDTAKALRGVAKYLAHTDAGKQAEELLAPADDHGGIISFRWIASSSIFLILIFGFLYLRDRARGGYKAEDISA